MKIILKSRLKPFAWTPDIVWSFPFNPCRTEQEIVLVRGRLWTEKLATKLSFKMRKVIQEIDSWVSLPGHHIPMPWVGKPGWPPTQSISIWWPRNETQQSSYILHFICLGPLIQSLRLHVQLQFLLHMLLTLSGGKSLVRVIVFSLNAWNKVCGYHKLKIFTRFVLLFQVCSPLKHNRLETMPPVRYTLYQSCQALSLKSFWETHFEKHSLNWIIYLSSMKSPLESILGSPCTPNGSLRLRSLHSHHVFFVDWGWDTLNIPLVVSTHSLKPLQQLHHE